MISHRSSVGLSIGSILLLVALGLAIIYGTMGVINLAHGEFVMLGAYAVWFLQSTTSASNLHHVSAPIVFLSSASCGWLIEWLLIRHLYTRPLDTILATWGVGVILQQAVRLSAGGELRYVQDAGLPDQYRHCLGYEDSAYRIFIFFVALALLVITYLLIIPYANSACGCGRSSQNREIARCFGINAGRDLCADVRLWRRARRPGRRAGLAAEKRLPGHGHQLCRGRLHGGRASAACRACSARSSAPSLGEVSGVLAFLQNDTWRRRSCSLAIVVLIRFLPQGLFTTRVRAGVDGYATTISRTESCAWPRLRDLLRALILLVPLFVRQRLPAQQVRALPRVRHPVAGAEPVVGVCRHSQPRPGA